MGGLVGASKYGRGSVTLIVVVNLSGRLAIASTRIQFSAAAFFRLVNFVNLAFLVNGYLREVVIVNDFESKADNARNPK